MRRFIILNLMLVTTVTVALACGPWGRPKYYMFSAFNRNEMGNTYNKGLLDYWGAYNVWQTLSIYDIEALSMVSPDDYNTTENPIINSAVQKNDQEMLEYLRLLHSYLQVSDGVQNDKWSYPTKEELQQRSTKTEYIYNRARSYSGTRLQPQYNLLAMRALMINKDYQNIVKWWETRVSKQGESVFKDMARGIYAHALLNTGKKREACEIYAELGDMRSLKWIVRDQRNLAGIQAEYAANPNSPTLVYLVQDYVNRAQSSLEQLDDYISYNTPDANGAYDEEIATLRQSLSNLRSFIPFAQQVVKEKKTKVPALWMSAAGHLESLLGNHKEGIAMLDKSMKMKGTQRMLDNARVCRLMATIHEAQATSQYKNYLLGELKWLKEVEAAELEHGFGYGTTDENHYSEMLANLCYDYLPTRFRQLGENNLATSLIGWFSFHENDFYDGYEAFGYTYHQDYFYALDSLTANQAADYQRFINSKHSDKLEQYLLEGIPSERNNEEYFGELIGTKLIREGRFEEAIGQLEKVSVSFIGSQRISAYMAKRTYKKEQWFELQKGVNDGEEPIDVDENQKLNFCRDMVATMKRANSTSGNEQAQAKYELASMYFQASCKGNCWYLSRYANSVYDDPVAYNNEKDFVAEAVRLLNEGTQQATTFDLKQKCLYASAYIPFGEPYITYDYDQDYNQIARYNTSSHEYTSRKALADFYRANRSKAAPYMHRCDVLKKFLAQN